MLKKLVLATTCLMLNVAYAHAKQPILAFSEAVASRNLLFLSGQTGSITGTDGKEHIVSGGITAETKQSMDNIKKVLEKNHSYLSRIVKCTVFLADIKDWPAMNEVYKTYFTPGHYPARTAVAAAGLVYNASVEIECVATI
jgi:reactive intermediate/imine deaminase